MDPEDDDNEEFENEDGKETLWLIQNTSLQILLCLLCLF